MYVEKINSIFNDYTKGKVLRVNQHPLILNFKRDFNENVSYRLFVTGETGLFYQWKNEPDYPLLYRSIVDSLDSENVLNSTYSLNLSSKKPERYVRRAYKKVLWPPKLSYIQMNPTPNEWDFGFTAKTENLQILQDGYVRMRIDVRFKHAGIDVTSNQQPADQTYIIDVENQNGKWVDYSRRINLQCEKIASLSIFFEGVNYSGKVYVEAPFIVSPKIPEKNILPDFNLHNNKDYYDWTGQYLSRKEWPEFKVTLNGATVFEGEIFERVHRASEWEIGLPSNLIKKENQLEIQLVSDYNLPLPYKIFEVSLIETENLDFVVLTKNVVGVLGGKAYVLIKTNLDNIAISARYSKGISGSTLFNFKEKGLHGISFDCNSASNNEKLILSFGNVKKEVTIDRIVVREEDRVVTGTGDMIYVNQNVNDVENFLAWYFSENVGNMLTFRSVYRWAGNRLVNAQACKLITRVLDEMNVKYSVMMDGRELPGLLANPTDLEMKGIGYLGRQFHERDGAAFYWRRYVAPMNYSEIQYRDMLAEADREDSQHANGQSTKTKYIYQNVVGNDKVDTEPKFDGDDNGLGVCYKHKNPNVVHDTEVAYKESVALISQERNGTSRHTGPSTLFKYMFDGGYTWLGAETMYGTMQPLLAFLRGACLDRKVSEFGVHHALQWSSSPEDTPQHVRRFRLALYVAYMNGASEINTEEGLWHLEEYYSHFNRFSDACKNHLKQQQDFYDYVKTHTRRGKYYSPIALIQGRYDGWHGFGRNSTWGWKNHVDGNAEKSWDLLNVFYPENNLGDALYYHGFDETKPLGFYSSTPHGNVDIIPIEANANNYANYKAIMFMGYNKGEKRDINLLLEYVKKGGKLLLSLAHLSCTTNYERIFNEDFDYDQTVEFFVEGSPKFEEKTFNGIPVNVCANVKQPSEVLSRADDGTPINVIYKHGLGEINLFAVNAYPAHKAIKNAYEKQMTNLTLYAKSFLNFDIFSNDKVEYTIFDRGDQKDLYLLAVDWYNNSDNLRKANLIFNGAKHEICLPFGVMIKATIKDNICAFPHDENGEVISICNDVVKVQGKNIVKFSIIKNQLMQEMEIDFTSNGVFEIKI